MIFKQKREEVGMTQSELAQKLNVDQSTVCLWETGKTLPRASMLPRIASLFKCSVDELLSYNTKDSIPTTEPTRKEAI